MGIEERQCEYYKCVASEYMIAYCNKCDKYFRRNSKYFCVYLNAPEMIYYEINICGYCQIKTKMTEEEIHVFEKEKRPGNAIRVQHKEHLQLYKQLERKNNFYKNKNKFLPIKSKYS